MRCPLLVLGLPGFQHVQRILFRTRFTPLVVHARARLWDLVSPARMPRSILLITFPTSRPILKSRGCVYNEGVGKLNIAVSVMVAFKFKNSMIDVVIELCRTP